MVELSQEAVTLLWWAGFFLGALVGFFVGLWMGAMSVAYSFRNHVKTEDAT